jgi:hypothetical protein
LEFFELDDEQWLKIRRRPPYAPRKPHMPLARQFVLGLEFMLWLWLL